MEQFLFSCSKCWFFYSKATLSQQSFKNSGHLQSSIFFLWLPNKQIRLRMWRSFQYQSTYIELCRIIQFVYKQIPYLESKFWILRTRSFLEYNRSVMESWLEFSYWRLWYFHGWTVKSNQSKNGKIHKKKKRAT